VTTPALMGGHLTGPQKAALMLVQLGREQGARVLQSMDDAEVEEIIAEVARLDQVHVGVMQQVMDEFVSAATTGGSLGAGGIGAIKDMLEEGLGRERARRILRRVDGTVRPFDFLKAVDPSQALLFLIDEHPQTIALVLAHLEPEAAAALLAGLPAELGADVAGRIATMSPPSPEIVRQVETILEAKLAAVAEPENSLVTGGVQPLVDILNRASPELEAAILSQLDVTNPALAEEVRRKMFVFDDIVKIDDRGVQMLLRDVDSKQLATALKGVSDDVRDKVMNNLSERAAANLNEEIELLGPVRRPQVEEARDEIIATIRSLEASGQIVLSRGGDSFVE
jgi:flagellar motor switch protein FliG